MEQLGRRILPHHPGCGHSHLRTRVLGELSDHLVPLGNLGITPFHALSNLGQPMLNPPRPVRIG